MQETRPIIPDGLPPERLRFLANHLASLLASTLKQIGVIHHAVTPDGPMLTTRAQDFLDSECRGAEWIVAAAIQKDGLVMFGPRPTRHDFPINTAYNLGVRGAGRLANQGFVTSEGRFVDRTEAEELARTCGQVKGQLLGSVLTSEDLW